MSLTKTISVDQITITEDGTIFYREVTRILENNVELSKNYYRSSIAPGQDLSNVPSNVVTICDVVWTPEIIATYKQKVTKDIEQQ
jgi:hypothetical protein